MKRFGLILAASWLMTASITKAGELDTEYGGKAKAADSVQVVARPSSELDAESPAQACCFKRKFCYRVYYCYPAYGFGYGGLGYGGGFGYGGFGCGGFGYGGGLGYGGYGGGFGYGGFGGYGGGSY